MDGWMMRGYCIVCVMGPHKIFGPRAPQSLNPALAVSSRCPLYGENWWGEEVLRVMC